MADIGIDLGTTNSVVAFLRGGAEIIQIKGQPLLPSAVAYQEGEWIVGQAAKDLAAASDFAVTSPKRNMGTDKTYDIAGKKYTPINMSAMILKEIKKAAESFLGEPVTSAIITHPAHFSQKQIEDTQAAGAEAGMKVSRLLAEPVAASATYGSGGEDIILVFDLGGGTLDCTVVNTFDAKILGLSGDNYLGGDDFDYRIVDRMAKVLQKETGIDLTGDEKARMQLKAHAERFKKNLSDVNKTQVEFTRKLVGNHAGKLVSIDFPLTRAEYNEMIKDLVDRSLEKADEAVKRAGLDKEDIDVVLLVGGSTLTPYVQERLQQHFGKPPSKKVDPMLAVGLGAAICTRDLPWDDKTHRVLLRSRADVWPKSTYTLRGRTTARSKISITGGARPLDGAADDEGKFALDVQLQENAPNDIAVLAVSPKGETARVFHRIRHDAKETKAVEPVAEAIIAPTLPRNIILGLKDEKTAVLIPHGRDLPLTGQADNFVTEGGNPNRIQLILPIYEGHMPEGEIPYAPFNNLLGELRIDCPPTPDRRGEIPLLVEYEVDESRRIRVKCWFRDDPSVVNEIKITVQRIERENTHIIERAERTINEAGERISPEEKARVNRKRQAVMDLCEQFQSSPTDELRKQIIETGKDLKGMIQSIEQKLKLK